MSGWSSLRLVLGVALAIGFVVQLIAPPAAEFPAFPLPRAGIGQRIFPGVPVAWVATRLLCLLAGACLVAGLLRVPKLRASPPSPSGSSLPAAIHDEERRPWTIAALGLAGALVVAGLFAKDFGSVTESLYLVSLIVPAILLAIGGRELVSEKSRRVRRALVPLFVVPVLWSLWALPWAWRSPRMASIIDGWLAIQALLEVVLGQDKALSGSWLAGFSNAYMLLQGVSVIGGNGLPTAATAVWLQAVNTAWAAVCSITIGLLVRVIVGPSAAIVAQVGFLFSPFVLAFPYNPLPIFLGPLFVSVLTLLFLAARDHRSPAALVAFGAMAGLSLRIPQITVLTVVLAALLFHRLMRMPRIPWTAVCTAAACGLAAMIPGLPNPATLVLAASEFTFGHGHMSGLLLSFFGQRSAVFVDQALLAGDPGPFDVMLGAILSPLAIARTPHRIWADTLFDPIGTVLMVMGLYVCLRAARRQATARLILVLLVSGALTALVSSGDIVSHTRLAPATVAVVTLMAIGFESVRLRIGGRGASRVLVWGAVVGMALGGSYVFHVVSPRVIPASWLSTALEATGTEVNATPAGFFEFGPGPDWAHTGRMLEMIPQQKMVQVDICRAEVVRTIEPRFPVYFWSPAHEQDGAISCLLCSLWPDATLYTMRDRAGLFATFAAVRGGVAWEPRLTPERWSLSQCAPNAMGLPRLGSLCTSPKCRPYLHAWPNRDEVARLQCGHELSPLVLAAN